MRNGFTLIEILIVISITTALAIGGTLNYLGLRDKKALDSMVSLVIFDLRSASVKSKAQENDMQWGIRFTNGSSDYYELWRGVSYSDPLGAKVKKVPLSLVKFIDPIEGSSKDVIFQRATGLPLAASVITIANRSSRERTITINANGRIDY